MTTQASETPKRTVQVGTVLYQAEVSNGAIRFLRKNVTRVTRAYAWVKGDDRWSDGGYAFGGTWNRRYDRSVIEQHPQSEAEAIAALLVDRRLWLERRQEDLKNAQAHFANAERTLAEAESLAALSSPRPE